MSRRVVRTIDVVEITCESCGKKLEIHADHTAPLGWLSVLVCIGDHTSTFDFCDKCVKTYTSPEAEHMHNPPDVWNLIRTAMADCVTDIRLDYGVSA